MKKFNQFISEASYSHAPGDKPKTWSDGYSYLLNYVDGGQNLESVIGPDQEFDKWRVAKETKRGASDVAWKDIVKQGKTVYTVTNADTGKTYQAVTLGRIAYIKYGNSILWGRAESLRKAGKSEFVK